MVIPFGIEFGVLVVYRELKTLRLTNCLQFFTAVCQKLWDVMLKASGVNKFDLRGMNNMGHIAWIWYSILTAEADQ